MELKVLFLCALAFAPLAAGFYFPGVSVREYKEGQAIKLKVNKLTSTKTQLPYDFYKLPFCQPKKVVDDTENLGEVLTGNVIENSAYELHVGDVQDCKILCRKIYEKADAEAFIDKIKDDYVVNWIVDNLPAAAVQENQVGIVSTLYDRGFALGGKLLNDEQKVTGYYLNNHHNIIIKYHEAKDGAFKGRRIVGFEVEPFSVQHTYTGEWKIGSASPPTGTLKTCNPSSNTAVRHAFDGVYEQHIKEGSEVVWTYGVQWASSPVRWASRWDIYLSMNGRYSDDVHWFSIINSLIIVVFLTGMVALILARTLRADVARYNRVPTDEERAEEREETGWKLVHADVFRPPTVLPSLLSVFVGTGCQVLAMAVLTLLFAALGFVNPANRGSLMVALLVLFVMCGALAGHASARTYKSYGGTEWQRTTLLTATLFPGAAFALFFLLNLMVWAEGSSGAVPFGSMLAMCALWFLVSLPLTFLGAYLGYRREPTPPPVRVNPMPRQVPIQPWYLHPLLTSLLVGVMPFGAVFIELFFILSSLWLDQYYYVFGFLLLVLLILLLTCAQISIVMLYFQLCSEDYYWHWRAFFTGGSCALYVFGYSGYYFFSKLSITHFVSTLLYFGYMMMLCSAFFLLTGVVGYYSCLVFNRRIYAAIKVD